MITGSLFAAEGFTKDVEYTCLGTQVVNAGQPSEVKEEEAKKTPFIFTTGRFVVRSLFRRAGYRDIE